MTAKNIKFQFNPNNLKKAQTIILHYPKDNKQSAILPLLDLAQRQYGGWLPRTVIEYVAQFLDMPIIRAYEIATFYTMFNLNPVGKYHIQVCTTTPCWLRNSTEILNTCTKTIGIKPGNLTKDKQFSLIEVECLGACTDAPVAQINDHYFEKLTSKTMNILIDKMKNNKL